MCTLLRVYTVCWFFFHTDIKPCFLFTSMMSLPHKMHLYTRVLNLFLESCFESFSHETIASSPLFSLCPGLLVFTLRATKLSEYPTAPVWEIASDNLLYLLSKTVKTHSEFELAMIFWCAVLLASGLIEAFLLLEYAVKMISIWLFHVSIPWNYYKVKMMECKTTTKKSI